MTQSGPGNACTSISPTSSFRSDRCRWIEKMSIGSSPREQSVGRVFGGRPPDSCGPRPYVWGFDPGPLQEYIAVCRNYDPVRFGDFLAIPAKDFIEADVSHDSATEFDPVGATPPGRCGQRRCHDVPESPPAVAGRSNGARGGAGGRSERPAGRTGTAE